MSVELTNYIHTIFVEVLDKQSESESKNLVNDNCIAMQLQSN